MPLRGRADVSPRWRMRFGWVDYSVLILGSRMSRTRLRMAVFALNLSSLCFSCTVMIVVYLAPSRVCCYLSRNALHKNVFTVVPRYLVSCIVYRSVRLVIPLKTLHLFFTFGLEESVRFTPSRQHESSRGVMGRHPSPVSMAGWSSRATLQY